MAITATHKPKIEGDAPETQFSVGDVIRVHQRISEGEKSRIQVYEGTVIKIKGRGDSKTFTVRRIGVQMVGIEKIFPLEAPIVEKVEVTKKGLRGVRRSKLYYIRTKSRKEISRIYSRANKREAAKEAAKTAKPKKAAAKKTVKKASTQPTRKASAGKAKKASSKAKTAKKASKTTKKVNASKKK